MVTTPLPTTGNIPIDIRLGNVNENDDYESLPDHLFPESLTYQQQQTSAQIAQIRARAREIRETHAANFQARLNARITQLQTMIDIEEATELVGDTSTHGWPPSVVSDVNIEDYSKDDFLAFPFG